MTTLRRFFLMGALLTGIVGVGYAQPGGSASKVTWTADGDTLAPGETGAVALRASIAEGWKMYAPASPPPTIVVDVSGVTSEPSGAVVRTDTIESTGASRAYDPNFGKEVHFFSGEARLRLPVSMSDDAQDGSYVLQGRLRFMVCTEEICLPPATETFTTTVVATD